MGHGNDLVFRQIGRLLDARMLLEVTRRSHHEPAHFADPGRYHRGIGEVRDAKRDVDAFVDQVDRPVEQQQPRRDGRACVQESVKDRPQHHFS